VKPLLLVLLSATACLADPQLIDAVKRAGVTQVRALLAQHADVNAADADGSTALHWAAQRDNLELVDLLLAAGANAKAATRYNVTPLSLACTNGDAAIIEHLLQAGADPNGTSEEGQTALMTAALTGQPDALKVLLAHGANPNVKEPYKGQTALMWAASEGNAAAEALLIEFGADVKAKSNGGFTPLLFAVRNDHRDAAKVLLDQRLFRNGRRSAGSRRGSQRARSPRLGAAGSYMDAQARRGWRGGGRQYGQRDPCAGRQPE
jgi:ankyrin repeat protein